MQAVVSGNPLYCLGQWRTRQRERTAIRIGSQCYSTAPGGAWANSGTTMQPGKEWSGCN